MRILLVREQRSGGVHKQILRQCVELVAESKVVAEFLPLFSGHSDDSSNVNTSKLQPPKGTPRIAYISHGTVVGVSRAHRQRLEKIR
jgi:hypothetical protein